MQSAEITDGITHGLDSLLLTEQCLRRESEWRFGDVFDNIRSLQNWNVPRNFELFLVPKKVFSAILHVPLTSDGGYPVPLGIMSCDPDLVSGVHDLLTDIVSPRHQSIETSDPSYDAIQSLLQSMR